LILNLIQAFETGAINCQSTEGGAAMKSKAFGFLVVFACSFFFIVAAWGQANVIVVAKSGGDFDNPVDAIDSITDAGRSNPYVISVAPGRYNLGETPLFMKSYVSLVGSGQKATYIVGKVDSAASLPDGGPGVINGADASEIRRLTVINRNSGTAHAIHNYDASPLISNVTAIARGGGGNGAFKAGVWDDSGSRSTLEHVTARALGVGGAGACLGLFSRDSVTRVHGGRLVANGCGINNGVAVSEGGRVEISDSHIIARSSGGINNGIVVTSQFGIEAYIAARNSVIRGSVSAGNVDGSGAPALIRIAASSIDGPVSAATGGDIKCISTFDADFNPLVCP
jgi:hypothetical protein